MIPFLRTSVFLFGVSLLAACSVSKSADSAFEEELDFFENLDEGSRFFDESKLSGESMAGLFEDPCTVQPAVLEALASDQQCEHCDYYWLPGLAMENRHTDYTIHSDLPEVLLSDGVAYATVPVLPPFETHGGDPVTREMRDQVNSGFENIDGGFEVFLFHISQPGDGTTPRRLVVYAKNNGGGTVEIQPRQAIVTDGIIGTVHEMESTLGRRVMAGDWDRPLDDVLVGPDSGRVVAYSKVFAAPRNTEDSSANVNCFGIVRADVVSKPDQTNLDVYIMAIPGETPLGQVDEAAEGLLGQGAKSGETYLDLNSRPEGCQLRRACGVFPSFVWRGQPLVLDAAGLPGDAVKFQMALPEIQTRGCEKARQTVDLLLSQKSNRPDTVGNYMVPYRTTFRLVNQGETARKVDFRFGKPDADIGLGWQIAAAESPLKDEELDALPVRTGWAGPKQQGDLPGDERSFFEEEGGAVTLDPCESVWISARFMVLGNSSLPFQIGFVSQEVE